MSVSLNSPARCSYFGSCGGCATQNIPYDEQLKLKAERVAAALALADVSVALKIHPSPQIWYYRNKMEFGVGDIYPAPPAGERLFHLGLKPKGRWYEVLDLSECYLLSPETPGLLEAVRVWAHENGISPYNKHKHAGLLRNLVVREAKNAPERLVMIVTSPGEIAPEPLIKAVKAAYPATTILRGISAKLSDTAVADTLEVWEGPGFITEVLNFKGRQVRFRVSPQSFFQTNTKGAEVLYGILREWAADLSPKALLDLYCGAGAIGLSLADLCGNVAGAEINPGSVEDAKANAKLNGISNADFFAASVERFLPELLDRSPDVVVVDPPRAGLHPNALKELLARPPKNILYVSCNPEALGRDLAAMNGLYGVEDAAMVDLFPHTEHVETAVRLARR